MPLHWIYKSLLAVFILMFAAQAASQPQEPTNPTCPVMVGDRIDPEIFLDHQGRRIWFADETARELFEFAPDDYLPNLPAEVEWVEAQVVSSTEPEPPPPFVARAFRLFKRSHPAFVHFPIALLIAAATAEVLSLRWQRRGLRAASAWCTILAALGALPAAVSGWFLAASHNQTTIALDVHRWLGVATAVSACLSVVLLIGAVRSDYPVTARRYYLVSLIGGAFLAGIAGHFGAILVYGAEYLRF